MALLQEWQKIAYNEQADRAKLQKFWQDYFLVEKGIYGRRSIRNSQRISRQVSGQPDGDDRIFRWDR